MLYIERKNNGHYTLRLSIFDADGGVVPMVDVGPVVVRDYAGVEVSTGESTIDGGDLVYALPVGDLPELGGYSVEWEADVDAETEHWSTVFALVSTPAVLGEVKTALRISSTAYDDEVIMLIQAARDDLVTAGVSSSLASASYPPPLVKNAIIVYCKSGFGMDNPDAEKFAASYQSLKTQLALSSEYQEPQETVL